MKKAGKMVALAAAALLVLSGCETASLPSGGTTSPSSPSAGMTVSGKTTPDNRGGATVQTTSLSTEGKGASGGKESSAVGKTKATGTSAAGQSNGTAVRTTQAGRTSSRPTGDGNWNHYVVRVAGMDNCCFALDPSTGTWNKRVREELDKVEQELGCTFSLSLYDSSSLTENCIKADKAGSKFADLMVTTLWQQSTLLENRVLQDLNSVQGLNLSNAHWDQNALDSMRLYGKNFIACTTWDGPSSRPEVLYFNKTLAKQVGSSDTELYRMVNDGTWTFDQMRTLCLKALKDLNGNGIDYENGTDQYGFTGMDIRQGESYYLFKGMGGYFTKPSDNGNDVIYALDDAQNLLALRTMQTWLLRDTSVFNWAKGGNGPEISGKMFREGRVLFLGGPASAAPDFAGMEDGWGILPYPKEDKNSDYISAVNWNIQGFSIPRQVRGTDLQRTAQAMEKIAQRFEGLREEQDGYLAKQVYRDTQTAQMVDIARDAVTVDLCQFGDLGSGGMNTIYFLFDSIDADPATRVNSFKKDTISHLNTFLKAIK